MYKTLKFFLTILLMCLWSTLTVNASKYYVFKFTGGVQHIVSNEKLKPSLSKQLSLRDKFVLEEGAVLALVDKDNHRLYYTRRPGEQTVAKIISNARKQSNEITSLASKQAFNSLKESSIKVPVLGAVSRGLNHQNDTTYLIYSALYEAFTNHVDLKQSDIVLSKIEQEQEWFFCVQNKTNLPLFVNVIQIPSAEHKPLLCFDVESTNEFSNILIAPKETQEMTQYPFAQTEETYEYLLFASKYPFDTQTLKILLQSGNKPMVGNENFDLYLYLYKP